MMITSRSNPAVRRAHSLTTRKGRQEEGLFLLEGEKIVREALKANHPIAEAFILEGHNELNDALTAAGAHISFVTASVMEAIADVKTPQWICAAAPCSTLLAPPSPAPAGMIVALDCVQDPGNLGTIIRTADAMGASGVLLGEGCADPFSPKVVRSAMGSLFHLPIWQSKLTDTLQILSNDGFLCICGDLHGEQVLPHPKDRCVIVIGNEGHGAAPEIAALCQRYCLPMYGQAESLNASIAAGILLYEVARSMHESHI